MNIIQLAGHLGSDVETRFLPDGTKVSSIRVATNTRRNGKDETVWWRVSLWGDRFDKMLSFLKKGSSIIVVGEFVKADVYNDREGKQQVSLEVRAEFLRFSPFGRSGQGSESKGTESTSDSFQPDSDSAQISRGTARQAPAAVRSTEFKDEDVPF